MGPIVYTSSWSHVAKNTNICSWSLLEKLKRHVLSCLNKWDWQYALKIFLYRSVFLKTRNFHCFIADANEPFPRKCVKTVTIVNWDRGFMGFFPCEKRYRCLFFGAYTTDVSSSFFLPSLPSLRTRFLSFLTTLPLSAGPFLSSCFKHLPVLW